MAAAGNEQQPAAGTPFRPSPPVSPPPLDFAAGTSSPSPISPSPPPQSLDEAHPPAEPPIAAASAAGDDLPPPSSTSTSSDEEDAASARKKQRPLSSFASPSLSSPAADPTLPPSLSTAAAKNNGNGNGNGSSNKKPKKKSNNVWTKSTSRKGKKKGKSGNNNNHHSASVAAAAEDTVLMTPMPRFPQDKTDDSPDAVICLSKVYKAEKVELSDDRLTAGSTKGYRMVRATRGVLEGAWYFEIRVLMLGETGHTRLGWTTDKGDLQAPVGYDGNSFGYRDMDGAKIHKALREKYGEEGYKEGDVIGLYINLPDGAQYAPKPPNVVSYKGQRYFYPVDGKDDPPKVVPGEHLQFK